MTGSSHTVLQTIAYPLPEGVRTKDYIEAGKNLEDIVLQARKEWTLLSQWDGEEHQELEGFGYGPFLHDAEDDDRLRLMGTLQLIADAAEGMIEEEEKD